MLLIAALFFSASAVADNNQRQLDQLQDYNRQLQQANDRVSKSKIRYETLKIEQAASQSKLRSLKVTVDDERKKLKDLRAAEEQFPNIDFTDQLSQQRAIWQKANREYLTHSEFVSALDSKINESRTNYDIAVRQQKNIQDSIDNISGQLANTELQKRLRSIQKSKRISIAVRETCSLSVTKDDCRDKARVKAERKASEKGSVVVVESVTEVKNFNLSKDEVRSRVKARISDIKVTKDSYDLTADKSGWVVDYAISALVTPVVTEQMMDDLKKQIILGLSSGSGSMSDSAMGESAEETTLVKRQNAEREMDIASKKAIREDQVQAELEAQALRRQAASRASEKAKEQADEEALGKKFYPTF
ncbi:MAG: hypothetical protein OQL09_06660 [Gammaproteobacteria bacterium]|nr:hypothetical protein [Gammaproteobacteria bacterium]